MKQINSGHFDWQTWRAGTLLDVLNIKQRTQNLIKNRKTLNTYAIGWAPAHMIPCRPKSKHKAVMFQVENIKFWTHLTDKEFDSIFSKIGELP